jgi:hypothetical protein
MSETPKSKEQGTVIFHWDGVQQRNRCYYITSEGQICSSPRRWSYKSQLDANGQKIKPPRQVECDLPDDCFDLLCITREQFRYFYRWLDGHGDVHAKPLVRGRHKQPLVEPAKPAVKPVIPVRRLIPAPFLMQEKKEEVI